MAGIGARASSNKQQARAGFTPVAEGAAGRCAAAMGADDFRDQ